MIKRVLRSRRLKAMVVGFIDLFFIKNPNKILFVVKDRTFFSGNLRVVCEKYIKEKNGNIYIYKDGVCPPKIKEDLILMGVEVLDRFTLYSIYHILTSGVVILSHNPRDAHIIKKFKSRKIINLWHGVAIKKIENLMPHITPLKKRQLENNSKLYDMVIASSKQDRITNIDAFGVESSIVKVTGLPRYAILQKSYPLSKLLQEESNRLIKLKANRKMVLFAPTFRESNISAIEQITKEEWQKLDEFLSKENLLFAIRPHPYDIKKLPTLIRESKNFELLLSSEFSEPNIVLKHSDILVVDFTSIWIDYLLLKRPIIGFAKDYKNYLEKERGFVYDFNSIFPTPFVDSMDRLIESIKKSMSIDRVIYKATTNTLHQYRIDYDFPQAIYNQIESIREEK